jgi:hypothetical protein
VEAPDTLGRGIDQIHMAMLSMLGEQGREQLEAVALLSIVWFFDSSTIYEVSSKVYGDVSGEVGFAKILLFFVTRSLASPRRSLRRIHCPTGLFVSSKQK